MDDTALDAQERKEIYNVGKRAILKRVLKGLKFDEDFLKNVYNGERAAILTSVTSIDNRVKDLGRAKQLLEEDLKEAD